MVKFGKELEATLIQEWKEEFMNYRELKKLIKRMKLSRTSNQSSQISNENYIFKSLHSIVKKIYSGLSPAINMIKLRKKTTVESGEEIYETELVQLFSQEDDVNVFFVRFDEELNKVNKFYITKENEFLESEETLKKQLQILVDLKQIINIGGQRAMPNIADTFSQTPTQDPNYSEFTAITTLLLEDLVDDPTRDINQKKLLHSAEKIIRNVFVELYKSLDLLKIYSSLNMVAFSKILKKFDKVFCQKNCDNYLKEVERSHFVNSDKVVRLMDEMEFTFTNHFTNNDRKKTMKFLRPTQQKDSHMINFFFGLFTGCFVSLFCVYVAMTHLYATFSHVNESIYMKIMYPIFSVFALLSLHLFMYGCNLYMWRKTRINYNLIFEFSPSTSLKNGDVFLICAALMAFILGAMVLQVILSAAGFSPSHVFSGVLLLSFIALLICPINMFYRPTRYFFIRVLRNIICSPFYKGVLIDFFMADQLTSQIPLIRHLETTTYNFVVKVFKIHHHETRYSKVMYMEIIYLISIIPYFWRAMQCARRWLDEGDMDNLKNMGKYVLTLVAAGVKVTYNLEKNNLWFAISIITSFAVTCYQLYWDIVKDWGFLNSQSRNPWLRDDLILRNKNIYYLSIALNIFLRVTWAHIVFQYEAGQFKMGLLEFSLAALEVIRRGHWNFYRLEFEQVRIRSRQLQ